MPCDAASLCTKGTDSRLAPFFLSRLARRRDKERSTLFELSVKTQVWEFRSRPRDDSPFAAVCRLRYGESNWPSLGEHEAQLCGAIVPPAALCESLDDVGGLGDVKAELRDLVVLPLKYPELFRHNGSTLTRAPRGVLLYGEPGTDRCVQRQYISIWNSPH